MTHRSLRIASLASVALAVTAWLVPVERAAGQGEALERAVRQIFVPQPRGSGETLDKQATPTAPAKDHVSSATTRSGDQISGTILTIDAGGVLRLSGPQYESEVAVRYDALKQVSFNPSRTDRAKDVVRLSNRDRIVGTLMAIDAENVWMETAAAGRMRIARRVIKSIDLANRPSVLVPNYFEDGELKPWETRGGGNSWTVTDGGVVCQSQGNWSPLVAPLDQNGPVTLVVGAQLLSGSMRVDLVLFASDPNQHYGNTSVFAMFQSSQVYGGYAQGGGTNHISSHNLGQNLREGQLRIAYDPATGKLTAWVNSSQTGEWTMPNKPTTGQFVLINAYTQTRFTNIQVLEGIVPPESDQSPGAGEGDGVQFANKDRVSIKSVEMAEGQFVITTGFGELRCPVSSVASLWFNSPGLETPRRQQFDVIVDAAYSAFTVEFRKLTDTALIGQSAHLGELTIPRAMIRSIKFNLYE